MRATSYTPRFEEPVKEHNIRKVDEYMTRNVITFSPDMNVYAAIQILLKNKIAGGPVLDGKGNMVGVLSENDCLRLLTLETYHNLPNHKVEHYMSTHVESILWNSSVVDAAEKFRAEGYRRLPVTKDGKLVGQISRRDCLRAISDEKNAQEKEL
ncbi:MAG: CBS domain-containing protein [Spirochaetaceae bacterium]|nr:CBS domain-containing protein [Spirochaetaceae bacterium]|tara:strand:+ start:43914 stop:44375 length:462 start_codon:yes stop_codon:yes gene_type:complete